ncbi:hypothetical protein phiSA039_0199 [Staphylococcus phage phiSA039]|nr:hypothetical protein phiSA039_0199 [Staphylococcus phage phiSA039]
MATEAKQTINTLYQRYNRALRTKQTIFNLSDDQIKEMDLEVSLVTHYSKSKTKQIIKGTDNDISMLIMILSKEEFDDKFTNIEIDEVNIIL